MSKFNPTKIGFKKSKVGKDVYDLLDKKRNLIAWMILHDANNWCVYKVKYFDTPTPLDYFCYSGRISSNAFAKQLLKNIL